MTGNCIITHSLPSTCGSSQTRTTKKAPTGAVTMSGDEALHISAGEFQTVGFVTLRPLSPKEGEGGQIGTDG